jgi:uncharacterized protein (DUF362 family)
MEFWHIFSPTGISLKGNVPNELGQRLLCRQVVPSSHGQHKLYERSAFTDGTNTIHMVVSVIHDNRICYPDGKEFYSPSEAYPEYPFAHTASRPNLVYQAVRNCLAQAGFDRSNYGTSSWNPLSYAIAEGSSAFILCNFVSHKRPHETLDAFFAKCTHGSVLRAILDYVLLAVGEKGTARFGNAPIQSCDWERVLEETGATRVVEFYKIFSHYVVEACDLRSHMIKIHSFGGITPVDKKGVQDEVKVDLGKDSLLEELYTSTKVPKFGSSDYNPQLINRYHDQGKHVYVLNNKIFEADIIVDVPKLKTHEKVGTTLGIKGCVGSIARKHCLAHFREGSPCEGGDEYQNGQFMNCLESKLGEFINTKTHSTFSNRLRMILFFLRKFILHVIGRNIGGGWIGNDTTWRMSMDIARILKHSDKIGVLCDNERRKIIGFIDGIIGGEGKGPLAPTPKPYGYLSYSDDIASGDYVAACFMGLNPEDFPIIQRAFSLPTYSLTNIKVANIQAIVNGLAYDQMKLTSLGITPFKLPTGWDRQL